MKIFSPIILLTFFVFSHSIAEAQNLAPEIEWEHTYGGSYEEKAYSIQLTIDGGYILAGTTSSNDGDVSGNSSVTQAFWILKLDSFGNLEWQKTLGGNGFIEEATSIQQTTDGGYIVAGFTDSNNGNVTGNHGAIDYWVVKLSATGNLEWQKALGGSGNDHAYSIKQTLDGGYVVAGFTDSNNGDVTGHHGAIDYWIVKLSTTGNIEWQKALGGSGNDRAYSIVQTTDGGYIVAGFSNSNNGNVTGNNGATDSWIVKLSPLGNIEWQKSIGGTSSDAAYSIQQTLDGGYIFVGYSYQLIISNQLLAVKLDILGNIEWQKTYGGSMQEIAQSVQQTADGGYIITGFSNSSDGDITGSNGDEDYWVLKLNAIGNLEWQKALGGSNEDQAYSIQQTVDEGYVVAGYKSYGSGAIVKNFWVIKLNYPKSNIYGQLFNDINSNCQNELNEEKFSNFIVRQTNPYERLVSTNNIGMFHFPVFQSGLYEFEPIVPEHLNVFYQNNCSLNYSLQIGSLGSDTNGLDFGFEIEPCPLLLIDVSSNRRRPCFTSTTSVSYSNAGIVTQNNVDIIVKLPDSVYPISASLPFTINTLGQLVFDLDSLEAQESGIITIIDSMACELSLTNTQACTKAWINPANTCYNNLVNPSPWDSSNIVINGGIQFDSLGDTCYRFVIANIGSSMQDSLAYNIYSGLGFIQSDSFLLGNNDSIAIVVCGVDYAQVYVDQHVNNPLASMAFFAPPNIDTGIINIYEFINVDENLESSIECLTVVNAYDPNDKNGTPMGWGDLNYVSPNTLLDYKIRFQNTGNDTAYTVEIIDTIDVTVFDLSRLILGGSSHPYTFEISGDSGDVVFHFIFNTINLVDSFTNEPLSHGFVNFKIGAYYTIPQGTIANNFADIYFDFNPPIRTNTSMVTLQDTLPLDAFNTATINIFPNCSEQFSVINVDNCDSIFLNGNWYFTSQLIVDSLQDANSCDSIVMINLSIYNSSQSQLTANLAANETYVSPSGNNIWSSSGIYQDTIPNSSGCDSIITINLTILDDTTGISTINNQFKIYPNPTNGELFVIVESGSTDFYNLEILDLTGKTLLSNSSFQNQTSVNLNQFSSGLYFIQIENQYGAKAFYRVMKE